MGILTVEDYVEIRALIDTQIDADVLPDSVIEMDVFLGAAEDDVLAEVPDAASKVNGELRRIKRAITCYTAAYLVESYLPYSYGRLGEIWFTRTREVGPAELAQRLLLRAEQDLEEVGGAPKRHAVFARVASRNRRWL